MKLCDKCHTYPAKYALPFLYKDMNDKVNPDLGNGYRQKSVCEECWAVEERIMKRQREEKTR